MSGPSAAALRAFEKRFADTFGEGVLHRIEEVSAYEVISTGSLMLDYATGVGGLVEGRIHEWWGQEGTGKSSMALNFVREAQAKYPRKVVGYIDMEQKLDRGWAQAQGVNLALMYHTQPDTAEDVADQIKQMVEATDRGEPLFSVVVVDSIGGMIAKGEFEKGASQEARIAASAKVITRMIKMQAVLARRHGTVILVINQTRANMSGFGKATTTGGGWALRHSSTMKMEFKRADAAVMGGSAEDPVQVGQEFAVLVERNNVAPPKRVARILLGTMRDGPIGLGVDKATEAFILGKRLGFIEQKGGGYYILPGGEQVRGEDAAIGHLRFHPEMVVDLRQRIVATRSSEVRPEIAPSDQPQEDTP